MSHWVPDFVSHAPDLPLWPGNSPHFGLGLWNSAAGTLLVEGVLWGAGIVFYLRARRAPGRVGPMAFWSLVIISTVVWLATPGGRLQ